MNGKKKDDGALLGAESKKVKVRKSRDSDCCSVNFLKCVLHIFNVVFVCPLYCVQMVPNFIAACTMFTLVAQKSNSAVLTCVPPSDNNLHLNRLISCGVLAVGIWTIVTRHRYVALLSTPTYISITYFLVAAGALGLPMGALGCCGLKKENRTSLLCYTYFLLITFILEAGAGGLAYYYEVAVETELRTDLNATFLQNYAIDPGVTRAVDDMQAEFRCCGAIRFEDWRRSTWLQASYDEPRVVPDSCCKTVTPQCGKRDHPSNIYYSGCLRQFTNHIRDHLIILAAVGVGMSVIPIFGFLFSCCLYIKIKHVID